MRNRAWATATTTFFGPRCRSTRRNRACRALCLARLRIAQLLTAYFLPNGSKLNFWPPTLASNMRPPLPVVKTATPF